VSAAARFHPALGRPFFAARGEGSRLWDVDGREYIDLHMSFGAALLGHGHPAIRRAVQQALDLGILCAFELEFQAEVARKISEMVPCAEQVRFTGSGTETTWHAVRTARAYTGRFKLVKFEGHFHGFSDVLGYSSWPPLAQAGPPGAPAKIPESAGMPPEDADEVIVLPWNDADALARTLVARGREIAAVIMEPINYNSGGIMPLPGYLQAVRELTAKHGVVLIFDEILSGFRTGGTIHRREGDRRSGRDRPPDHADRLALGRGRPSRSLGPGLGRARAPRIAAAPADRSRSRRESSPRPEVAQLRSAVAVWLPCT